MTTATSSTWFDVDKAGLGRIVKRRGPAWWVFELIQNALDEPGVTEVNVTMTPSTKRGRTDVVVTDDAPAGWDDMSHAWTMFAESKKAGDPELRGRFDFGEKLFLSICDHADIISMTSAVRFNVDGTRRPSRRRTDIGTEVRATVQVNGSDIPAVLNAARSIIVPQGVQLKLNGDTVFHIDPIGQTTGVALPSEFTNEDGEMRRTTRQTTVTVYNPPDGQGRIFEMGIPICKTDGDHWIDIGQTVPMSIERDSVTPKYLAKVYAAVLDAVADTLDHEQAARPWVDIGLPDAAPESVTAAVGARYGDDAVVLDPNSPESNKLAIEQGRTLIPSNAFGRDGWDAVRRARDVTPGFAPPAGRAIPVGVRSSPDGVPPLERSKYTPAIAAFERYATKMIRHITGQPGSVTFYRMPITDAKWAGAWSTATNGLSINLSKFPVNTERPSRREADELLIHELAHNWADDHLTPAFYDACCRVGAALRDFDQTWSPTNG